MPDIGGALGFGASLIGDIFGSESESSAASDASAAQVAASRMQVEESRRQFDEIRKLLQPYVTAGTGAVGQQQALLGLNGAAAQRSAIRTLETSPQMEAMIAQGENAIRQNASATGGLRGGNIQAALAQFRPQVLSSMIENQFSRLGGLSSLGQNAAAGVGNAGMTSTANINAALGQMGQAQAGAALASGAAQSKLFGSIGEAAGTLAGSIFGKASPVLTLDTPTLGGGYEYGSWGF